MSYTEGKCEVVHTNWRTSILVFGGRIMAECNVDPDFDEDNASDVEAEDAEMEKAANARRLAALWNAAEELGLATEKIAEGEIQRTFTLAESRAGVIAAVLERIEKLEAEKAEIVEKLEKVNSKLYYCDGDYYWYEATFTPGERDEIQAAIRKARGEE